MARKTAAKAKPATAKTTTAKRTMAKTTTATTGSATARHYCQGIGDCHLLSFPKSDGGLFWMLIDCGVHSSVSGGSTNIAEIAEQTKHIDVLVVTHEHTDHA